MNTNDLVKQLLLAFTKNDGDAFVSAAQEYIEHEKRLKHSQIAKDLENVLFEKKNTNLSFLERRFKNSIPIPRDSEKGFPLLEIQHPDIGFEKLLVDIKVSNQIIQIIREFQDSELLASYNLQNKKKILLCGKPGTGKTFTAKIVSSELNIPLIYIRFDAIISSYLGETASNLRKVFDFIEQGTWIVLFDEVDIIGKNRNDLYEHGEIKRVVNNFLQMLDNFTGTSIIFAATNHQFLLDPAIWRRFDDVIYYGLPDTTTRKKLFYQYLAPLYREHTINIDHLVEKSENLSHADIKMVSQESLKYAILNKKKELSNDDLNIVLENFLIREQIKAENYGE
jgi:SpoVK/Ycf46/Vps4 family AAA+-type ATPase